jgi:hypothetical protein
MSDVVRATSPRRASRAFAMANIGGVPHRLERVTAYAAETTASTRSTDPLLARIRSLARVRHRDPQFLSAALRVELCSCGAIPGTDAAANASSPTEIVTDPEALTSRTGGISPTQSRLDARRRWEGITEGSGHPGRPL